MTNRGLLVVRHKVTEEIVETMAAALHTYWVEEYRKAGFTSRLSSWGDEFMLPWEELSERSKDFDRRGILAAVRAMYAARYRLDQPQEVTSGQT